MKSRIGISSGHKGEGGLPLLEQGRPAGESIIPRKAPFLCLVEAAQPLLRVRRALHNHHMLFVGLEQAL